MHKEKDNIDVGDIVKIDGYLDRLFEVISVEKVHYKDRETEYAYTEYETLGITDRRNYLTNDEDISLHKKKGIATELTLDISKYVKVDKSARIDELLTQLNDVNALIKNFGEHEDDERKDRRYVLMKAEIEAELLELTGGVS